MKNLDQLIDYVSNHDFQYWRYSSLRYHDYPEMKGDFSYQNTEMYFRSNLARFDSFSEGNLHGSNHGPWQSEMDRYDDISSWALRVLTKHQVTQVYLEPLQNDLC